MKRKNIFGQHKWAEHANTINSKNEFWEVDETIIYNQHNCSYI